MSKAQRSNGQLSSVGGPEFSNDELLEMLSNQRRRFTIHYLKQREGEHVSVSELTDWVASWENDTEIEALTHQERKRVRNALRQFHLPKMDDHGFIEYDSRRGTVTLTDEAADANFYVDSLTGGDIPWGIYYLGLSAFCGLCLLGYWAGLFPFTLVEPFTWSVFVLTALTISSVGHFYDNYYRMRLGARDKPPEVDEE